METALAPWCALADVLLPQWHHSICRAGCVSRLDETLPPMAISLRSETGGQEAAKRQQLRETLTVFALAYELNAAAFAAAVCAYKQLSAVDCRLVDEIKHPRLRLKVTAAVGSQVHGTAVKEMTTLLKEWSSSATSEELKRSVAVLRVADASRSSGIVSQRFDLELQLELLESETHGSRVSELVDMVEIIDHTVFNITAVSLSICDADYADNAWESLLPLLHRLRSHADIHIQARLPSHCGIGFLPLVKWKKRFDLITKTPRKLMTSTYVAERKRWDVTLRYMHPDETSAAARAIISSLSALAHSTVGISSLSLSGVLQVQGGSLYAKWLGYLLQATGIETLHLTEGLLTREVVDAIEVILSATTHAERQQRLWFAKWYDENLVRIESVRDSLADETQCIGVMFDNAKDPCVEVHLAGFGQCRVDRQVAGPALDKLAHRSSVDVSEQLVTSQLKSLRLTLHSRGAGIDEYIVRLITLIGSSLEELTVETQFQPLQLVSLVAILRACPHLRQLSIPLLRLTRRDDTTTQFNPELTKPHALEALTVGLVLDEAASGLAGFARVVGHQLQGLMRLHLRDAQRGINQVNAQTIGRVLSSNLPALSSVRVSDLHMPYSRDFLYGSACDSRGPVEVLEFDGVTFTHQAWQTLMATLSDDSHPLARSVQTLVLRLDDPDAQKSRDIASMLERNHFLVDVQVVFQGRGRASIVRDTNGVAVHRRKGPLPMSEKAALLSALELMELPLSSDILSGVFVFAAPVKTRRARLSCC